MSSKKATEDSYIKERLIELCVDIKSAEQVHARFTLSLAAAPSRSRTKKTPSKAKTSRLSSITSSFPLKR